MPSATFQHRTTIDAPQDQIWDGLQDPDVWTSIGPVQNVWDPHFEGGVLSQFQWSTDIGGIVYEGTGTASIQERPDRYQLMLDMSEMAAIITVDLAGGNLASTEVAITVELRSKGLLATMFFPAVSRAIGDALPSQVDAVAARLGA